MPPILMRNITMTALALFLWACAPVARASDPCRFQDWLVQTSAAALAFSDGLQNGEVGAAARRLQLRLSEYSLAEVRATLQVNGLASLDPRVTQFLQSQQALLDRYSLRGRIPALAYAMSPAFVSGLTEARRAILGLHCSQSGDEHAGPARGRLLSVRMQGHMLNWGIFLGMMTLVTIGTIALARIQARRRRRAWRHSCNIPGQFSAGSRSSTIRAVDISCLGAKLHLPNPPAAGQTCRLTLKEQAIDAEIIWANASHCGVRFHPRIARDVLALILARNPGAHEKGGAGTGAALSDPENQPA